MNKLFLALVFLSLLLPENRAKAGALDNRNPTANIQAVTLFEAYESNALAAEQQYKGRRVAIVGEVKEVAQDRDGSPYLLLSGAEHSFYGVKCKFSSEWVPRMTALTPGSNVTVHGTIEGRRGAHGNVLMVGCRLP